MNLFWAYRPEYPRPHGLRTALKRVFVAIHFQGNAPLPRPNPQFIKDIGPKAPRWVKIPSYGPFIRKITTNNTQSRAMCTNNGQLSRNIAPNQANMGHYT